MTAFEFMANAFYICVGVVCYICVGVACLLVAALIMCGIVIGVYGTIKGKKKGNET